MKGGVVLTLIITACVLALSFQQKLIVQRWLQPRHKIAIPLQSSRTQLNDDYHYYISAKQLRSSQDRPMNYALGGAIGSFSACDWLTHQVGFSQRTSVLLSMILQTVLLTFMFLLFCKSLLSRLTSQSFPLLLYFLGFITILAIQRFQLSSFTGLWLYPYPLLDHSDWFRLVNPAMGWALAMGYLYFFIQYLEEGRSIYYYGLLITALLFGGFLIPLAITTLLASGLFWLWSSLNNKNFNKAIFLILVLLTFSIILLGYWPLHIFSLTLKGQNLGVTHLNWKEFKPAWHFLILTPIIPLFWLTYRSLKLDTKLFATCIIASALVSGIITPLGSFMSRFWVRGASLYVWIFLIVTIAGLIIHLIKYLSTASPINKIRLIFRPYRYLAFIFIAVLGVLTVAQLDPLKASNWDGYLSKPHWDALMWLNQNAKPSAKVVSSNIEDSYLLPIYTHLKPTYELIDTTTTSNQTNLLNYFKSMQIMGVSSQIIRNIINFNNKNYLNYLNKTNGFLYPYFAYQTAAFFDMIIYYPYMQWTQNILQLSSEQHKTFINTVIQLNTMARFQDIHYDYLLINTAHDHPAIMKNEKLVYSNENYQIFYKPSSKDN